MKKVLSLLIVATLVLGVFGYSQVETKASAGSAFNAVKSAYGKKFPLKSSNMINTTRKNIFGRYSKVLGVSAKNFTSYKAARKSNGKTEYIAAIFRAGKGKVSKIKKALKKYVKKERSSNRNYFSNKGKRLLSRAKVGSKGRYVYLFILDVRGNKKAVSAFKRAA